MCVVSNIGGYGMGITPNNDWWKYQPATVVPYVPPTPPNPWTPSMIKDFQELVERARKWDQNHGQPDCVDPEKDRFLRVIEELSKRIDELEDRLDGQDRSLG